MRAFPNVLSKEDIRMNRKGFTLIELLIVVVIIGILAAIAIPKFANTKEKAYIASMKSDLRNLVTAEEAYFADSIKYQTATSCTNPAPAGNVSFCPTQGNTLGAITTGTGTQAGWTGSITNLNTSKSCAIYVGAVTPTAPATSANSEGAPVCQ
jgi:type IV pilus assembly protein PilA